MSFTKTITNTSVKTGVFPIEPIVRDLLGEAHYVSISQVTAEIIYIHCRNKWLCHVQFVTDDDATILGEPLKTPRLWSLQGWQMSVEKYLRDKARSARLRDERNIFDANIILVARAIYKVSGLPFDICKLQARRWLNENNPKIYAVGVKKIYTTIQELP